MESKFTVCQECRVFTLLCRTFLVRFVYIGKAPHFERPLRLVSKVTQTCSNYDSGDLPPTQKVAANLPALDCEA